MKKYLKNQKSINLSKKLFLIALMLFPSFGAFAQIKVDANGKVSLHTSTTDVTTDVLIYGTMKLANSYGTNVSFTANSGETIVEPGSNNTGYVGSSSKQFRQIRGQYHYATTTLLTSDKRLKENFRTIDQPLEKILKLTGKKYDFITESSDTIGDAQEKEKQIQLKKDKLGFIAQEVQEIVPEAVVYDKEIDCYYIDYNAIIPVIVEAMKEQQTTIDDLTARIEKLEGNASTEKSAKLGDTTPASLEQNIPNPFTANSTINMFIPNTVTKAVLYIYTMQGEQIKQQTIHERGNTSATIEGHSLKAGMYLYTLIADGKEVDTHKMILTK